MSESQSMLALIKECKQLIKSFEEELKNHYRTPLCRVAPFIQDSLNALDVKLELLRSVGGSPEMIQELRWQMVDKIVDFQSNLPEEIKETIGMKKRIEPAKRFSYFRAMLAITIFMATAIVTSIALAKLGMYILPGYGKIISYTVGATVVFVPVGILGAIFPGLTRAYVNLQIKTFERLFK